MKIDQHIFISETKRTRRSALALLLGLAMMICALLLLGLQAAKPAQAAGTTFTVNSTGDAGADGSCDFDECTLREAITAANNTSAADTIKFNIRSSACDATTQVCTISPSSELPQITHPVTIDGYTQSDAKENDIPLAKDGTDAVLKIVLDGTNAGPAANGLDLSSASASNSVIRGLVINNFALYGILLGGSGYKVEGNFIGTNASGTAPEGNVNGVYMGTSNATLGGTSPADRNLISGNQLKGIDAEVGTGSKIEGNLIGTAKDGTSSLANGDGVDFSGSASNVTIGDSDPSDGLTNAANTIAFNTTRGIIIERAQNTGNRILSNSIFSNGSLGIDLRGSAEPASGVTPNDPRDPDTGPNRLQNYPLITNAQFINQPSPIPDSLSIHGTLDSTPSTRHKKRTFIIQFFKSPEKDSSGYGEGKTFLGQVEVRTNRQGQATFDFGPTTTQAELAQEPYITATATNKATGDTSEFSAAEAVQGISPGG